MWLLSGSGALGYLVALIAGPEVFPAYRRKIIVTKYQE
jgi:hypothetical protein